MACVYQSHPLVVGGTRLARWDCRNCGISAHRQKERNREKVGNETLANDTMPGIEAIVAGMQSCNLCYSSRTRTD